MGTSHKIYTMYYILLYICAQEKEVIQFFEDFWGTFIISPSLFQTAKNTIIYILIAVIVFFVGRKSRDEIHPQKRVSNGHRYIMHVSNYLTKKRKNKKKPRLGFFGTREKIITLYKLHNKYRMHVRSQPKRNSKKRKKN